MTKDARAHSIGRLDERFDAIVIGGGITGAGLLAELTQLGKKALLVEARDFAWGTSSRSTKLVHGGLRYLRQGQVHVTRESVVERERLMREGGSLVSPLGFNLTSFEGDKLPGWMMGLGLAVYDVIAGRWDHRKLSRDALVRELPALRSAPVVSGYRYLDAQTDDARLTLRVLAEATRRGGVAINYLRAIDLMRTAEGRVRGVVLRDEVSEATHEVQAELVINATGAWADELRGKVGRARKLRLIRGSHLVFGRDRAPIHEAISFFHPRDRRAVFAIPWEGVTIVGTTDIDHDRDLWQEPVISGAEAEYIMEAAHRVFPDAELSERDVRATWSGVRGVVDSGAADPSKESREHVLFHEDGLLTVTGGKLTTFRAMARHTLKSVGLRGARRRIFEAPASVELAESLGVSERTRLLGRYGQDAPAVAALGGDGAHDRVADTHTLWCELAWAAQHESVVHLDDLLLRRVRLGVLLAEGGASQMERVRALVQPGLGWSDERWRSEQRRYEQIWGASYGAQVARGATPAADVLRAS